MLIAYLQKELNSHDWRIIDTSEDTPAGLARLSQLCQSNANNGYNCIIETERGTIVAGFDAVLPYELYAIRVEGILPGGVRVSRYLSNPDHRAAVLMLPRREAKRRAARWMRKFGRLDSNAAAIIERVR